VKPPARKHIEDEMNQTMPITVNSNKNKDRHDTTSGKDGN